MFEPTLPNLKLILEARIHALLYLTLFILSVYFQSAALLWYWVLPSLVGQPALRFFLYAEHNGCKTGLDMLQNTRTTYTNWFYSKLSWSMNYHKEHHAFPQVPFHQLHTLHSQLVNVGAYKEVQKCSPSGVDGYIDVNVGSLQNMSK